MKPIVASTHALSRWRERVSIYGDETIVDMRRKLDLQLTPPAGLCFWSVGDVTFLLDTKPDRIEIVTVIDETPKALVKQERVQDEEFVLVLPDFEDISELRCWLKTQLNYCSGIINKLGKKNPDSKYYKQQRKALEDELHKTKQGKRGLTAEEFAIKYNEWQRKHQEKQYEEWANKCLSQKTI